ncbi:MAG: universal stress protein, partial [Candidatus Dormibacteraceae bacterium]
GQVQAMNASIGGTARSRPAVAGPIVVAIVASEPARWGLALVARLAVPLAVPIVAVHVRHVPVVSADAATIPEVEAALERARAAAEAMAGEVLAGLNWSFEVASGLIGPAIIERAEALHADLIVVGAHRHSVLHNIFVGSTTLHLVEHSPIPVLVARQGRLTSAILT